MNYGIHPLIIAFDLLRPPYWILWGQYRSNLNFDLGNGIPDPKNGIYHVSHYGIAMNYGIHPSIIAFDLLRPPYWILLGQYVSNLHFDLRNGIPDPKNGIYHIIYHTMV